MEAAGIEHSDMCDFPGEFEGSPKTLAHSLAHSGGQPRTSTMRDLQRVCKAWSRVSEDTRRAILAIVEAACRAK